MPDNTENTLHFPAAQSWWKNPGITIEEKTTLDDFLRLAFKSVRDAISARNILNIASKKNCNIANLQKKAKNAELEAYNAIMVVSEKAFLAGLLARKNSGGKELMI